MKRSPKEYTHAQLAHMLEQADKQIEHQRRVMDDMQDELDRTKKDNAELRRQLVSMRSG